MNTPRLTSPLAVFIFTLASLVASNTAFADAPSQTPTRIKIDGQELYAVGFDKLAAFEYTLVDAGTGASEAEMEASKAKDQIPAWVRLYDKQKIALTGFMLPLVVENGLVRKLIMMRDVTTCCFGNVPNMNEYVIVTMKGEGIKPLQDVPVVLTGTFKISEIYEGGYLTSIFQMDGEKFLGPKK